MARISKMACIVALSVTSSLGAAAQSVPVATAQDAGKAGLTFEVVSVRPHLSDSMQTRMSITADGISLSGIPLNAILRLAFGMLWNDRIIGGPGWISSSRFDIEAKVAPGEVPAFKNLKPAELSAMLLPVLQDRFAMKFHHETRDMGVYTLEIAKGGPKMKEADAHNQYPNGYKVPDNPSGAGIMRMMPGEFIGQAVRISNLVQSLSLVVDKTVADKTGLTGRYDFDMKWEPDESAGLMLRGPDGAGPPLGAEPASQGTGPSIFVALQEQLGLKLVAQKEPIDVIVIDHIEEPTAN